MITLNHGFKVHGGFFHIQHAERDAVIAVIGNFAVFNQVDRRKITVVSTDADDRGIFRISRLFRSQKEAEGSISLQFCYPGFESNFIRFTDLIAGNQFAFCRHHIPRPVEFGAGVTGNEDFFSCETSLVDMPKTVARGFIAVSQTAVYKSSEKARWVGLS